MLFMLLSIMKEALPQFTVVTTACLNSRGNDVLERVEKFELSFIAARCWPLNDYCPTISANGLSLSRIGTSSKAHRALTHLRQSEVQIFHK